MKKIEKTSGIVKCEKGDAYALLFDISGATMTRNADNLEMTFEDGEKVVFEDFYKTEGLSFIADGQEIPVRDFLSAMNDPSIVPAEGPQASSEAANNRYHDWGNSEAMAGIWHLNGLDISFESPVYENEFLREGIPVRDEDGVIVPPSPAPEIPETVRLTTLAREDGEDESVLAIPPGYRLVEVVENGLYGHVEQGEDGEWRYVLTEKVDSGDIQGKNVVEGKDTVIVLLETPDGTLIETPLAVDIMDDMPEMDVPGDFTVDFNENGEGEGFRFDFGADDGPGRKITVETGGKTVTIEDPEEPFTVKGEHGTLIVQPDGSYTYIPDDGKPNDHDVTDRFSFMITDADNDSVAETSDGKPGVVTVTVRGIPKVGFTGDAKARVLESDLGDNTAVDYGEITLTNVELLSTLMVREAGGGVHDLLAGPVELSVNNGTLSLEYKDGTISWFFRLDGRIDHEWSRGQNSAFEGLTLVANDIYERESENAMSVEVVDDIPVLSEGVIEGVAVSVEGAIAVANIWDYLAPGADATGRDVEFASLQGEFGSISIENGVVTYALSEERLAALLDKNATERFEFSYTDADGDTVSGVLEIPVSFTAPSVTLTPGPGNLPEDSDPPKDENGNPPKDWNPYLPGNNEDPDRAHDGERDGSEFDPTDPDWGRTAMGGALARAFESGLFPDGVPFTEDDAAFSPIDSHGVIAVENPGLLSSLVASYGGVSVDLMAPSVEAQDAEFTVNGGTVKLSYANGEIRYSFHLDHAMTHTDEGGYSVVEGIVDFTATDKYGRETSSFLLTQIVDDIPEILVEEREFELAMEEDTTGAIFFDSGADREGATLLVKVNGGEAREFQYSENGYEIAGEFGVLTIENGEFVYRASEQTPGRVSGVDRFDFTLRDGDNDTANEYLEFKVLPPKIEVPPTVTDERLLSLHMDMYEGFLGQTSFVDIPEGYTVEGWEYAGALGVAALEGNRLSFTLESPATSDVQGNDVVTEEIVLTLKKDGVTYENVRVKVNVTDDVPDLALENNRVEAGGDTEDIFNYDYGVDGAGMISFTDVNGNDVAAEAGAEVQGQFGTLVVDSVEDGQIKYTYHANEDVEGVDTFTVKVSDAEGDVTSDSFSIDVLAAEQMDSLAFGGFEVFVQAEGGGLTLADLKDGQMLLTGVDIQDARELDGLGIYEHEGVLSLDPSWSGENGVYSCGSLRLEVKGEVQVDIWTDPESGLTSLVGQESVVPPNVEPNMDWQGPGLENELDELAIQANQVAVG